MARIVNSSDDGYMTHFGRAISRGLGSQHFCRCPIERGQRTVSDARRQTDSATTAARSRPGGRHPRAVSVAAVRDVTRKLNRAGASRGLAPAS
jgi:hypothetical protein